MYSVKQPFEWLTEQQGLLLKGFSFRGLSWAFHLNCAQLRGRQRDRESCPCPLEQLISVVRKTERKREQGWNIRLYFSATEFISFLCLSCSCSLPSYLFTWGQQGPSPDYEWHVHGHTFNTSTEVKGIWGASGTRPAFLAGHTVMLIFKVTCRCRFAHPQDNGDLLTLLNW